MVSIQVTSSHAPVQYRRPFRLRAGSTAWCVAAVHTGAVSTDRVPLLDGPEPRAHPMDDRLGQVLPAYAAIRRVLRRLVNGLDEGAPVKFCGVPIGTDSDVRLKLPPQPADDQRIPVLVEIDEDRMREPRRELAVGLGPITFPPCLDRSELVSRVGTNELRPSPFDFWTGPLNEQFKSG